jgi:hypothetical protein
MRTMRSARASDDGGQGCSSWAAKAEPASDDDDNGGADYDILY